MSTSSPLHHQAFWNTSKDPTKPYSTPFSCRNSLGLIPADRSHIINHSDHQSVVWRPFSFQWLNQGYWTAASHTCRLWGRQSCRVATYLDLKLNSNISRSWRYPCSFEIPLQVIHKCDAVSMPYFGQQLEQVFGGGMPFLTTHNVR